MSQRTRRPYLEGSQSRSEGEGGCGGGRDGGRDGWALDVDVDVDVDVPLELVGEVAGARAVAEAGHVEGGAASARHGGGAVFSRMWGQKGALDEAGGAVEREGRW